MRIGALFALTLLLPLASCKGGDQATTTTGQPKYRIAMIPKGTTHEYWKSVHEGADKAAKEFGVDLIWKGPLKEDDRADQIKVVEQFTLDKVDGICLAPLDDTALVSYVKDAESSGIPVAIFDSGLKYDDVVSYVATDNYAAGGIAGTEMGKLLDGKGKVIVLRYNEGSASTTDRENGFIDAAKKAGLEIASDEQFAGVTVETAQDASENLLTRFKQGNGLSVQGIFCPNESSAFGMLRALQDTGLAGKVKFIGFDASQKLIEGLTSGQIDGLIVQNPRKMGYETIKAIVDKIKGGTPEKRIDTGATFVTKANMETDEVKQLLAPPTD
ncbi:MAG TPA: substrate-binding domain-containing protein [Fimbriimonadaceae bacterium]|nr:substrate-binding domain-containing protein [Fimbriimonadaceae bacterium]